MELLPPEMIAEICKFLPYFDNISLALTSQRINLALTRLKPDIWEEFSQATDLANLILSNYFSTDELVYISQYYDMGYDFTTLNTILSTLYNWVIFTRCYYQIYKNGCPPYRLMVIEQFDRAKRRLETWDFYVGGHDPEMYFIGIWSLVSIFDSQERKELILYLGDKQPELIQLINKYRFDYAGIN